MKQGKLPSWRAGVGLAALVGAAALVVALTSGAGTAAVGAASDNNTIVYAIPNTPPDLDPSSSAEFVESELFTNTLSRLFDYKTTKRSDGTYVMQSAGYMPVVGSLVQSWTVSPDKKTITVHLRQGVTNFLGDKFTAADVTYTFDRLLALHGTGTFYESSIGITKPSNIQVVNPYTVMFKLDFAAELFFKMMAIRIWGSSTRSSTSSTRQRPTHGLRSGPHEHVGFGPYQMTQNQQGVQVVLEADPNYWGHKPAVQNIIEKRSDLGQPARAPQGRFRGHCVEPRPP